MDRAGESAVAARVFLVTAGCSLLLLAYLVVDPAPAWALAIAGVLAALGTDGIVRLHPRWRSDSPVAAAAHLFLPAVATMAAGLFLRDRVDGFARPLSLIPIAGAIWLVVHMEYVSVDASHGRYQISRVVLALATYLSAFAMFTLITPEEVRLPVSAVLAGLVSLVLSIELLREDSLVSSAGLAACLALGVGIGEFRWALYYLPLDELVSGALLLVGFYAGTGFSHHLLERTLNWSTAFEYLAVAAVGAAAVIITQALV